MNMIWEPIRKFFDYNRFTVIAVILSCFVTGCAWLEATTPGPISGKRVNFVALKAEEQEMTAKFSAAYEDLAAKQERINAIKGAIGSVGAMVAESVPTPWSSILTIALGTLSAGALTDNIRKNNVISAYKAQRDAALAGTTTVSTKEAP